MSCEMSELCHKILPPKIFSFLVRYLISLKILERCTSAHWSYLFSWLISFLYFLVFVSTCLLFQKTPFIWITLLLHQMFDIQFFFSYSSFISSKQFSFLLYSFYLTYGNDFYIFLSNPSSCIFHLIIIIYSIKYYELNIKII